MNSPLKQNTTDLQELLEVVNNLPEFLDTTDATATVNDILSGKTAYANGNIKIGTMANNGAVSKTLDGVTTKSVTIPAGYTSGGTVSMDGTVDNAVTAALSALVEKGVEIPDGTNVTGLAALIAAIEAGGGELSYIEGTFLLSENTELYEVTHNLGKIPKVVLLSFDNYYGINPVAMGNKNQSVIYIGYANERGMTISTNYTVNNGVTMEFWTSKAGFDITNTSSDLGCAISNATEEKITFGYHSTISASYLRNLSSYRYIIGG